MLENSLSSSVKKLIAAYSQAINEANVQSLTELFTANGLLMPQGAPAISGQTDILSTYTTMLAAFCLRVTYEIDSIENEGGIAIVRTHSSGTATIQSSGAELPVSNKEVFVLQNRSGQWKIALYIFNNNSRS